MSVSEKKPEVVVFAGPNGSGKSTFTELLKPPVDYINADEIKKMQNTCETVNAPGVFMEVLEKEFMSRAMDVSIMSMEEAIERLSEIKRDMGKEE